ncbi:E3 ubiquitin-protein ligase TRIM56-like [Pocillopora damicornis]|uniref:E3 ubiquitin-protein ligase TRIM56-like n=1 Tax=Pocillopora damicornis TaxID=46731 RepID=UPI000F5599C7|nr:E3 ubiquitin-protein ligase TRIM56-like [Pocillopora damicornis]
MESLLVNLKKQLTCSICLDTYTEPKTISCLHTFCCECLAKHARVSQKKGKFRCPECQAAIDLSEGNRFDRLPNSFFHNNLLSLLAVRQTDDASSINCCQCGANNSQMYYCFDCGRFMCPGCFNAHEVLKKSFQGHKVTPLQDFKTEDYEALLRRQPFCSQQFHEREIARFFCSQCQVCICQICIVTDHENHKVVGLDKAAHEEKDNIMSDAKLIKEMESELREVIKQFEETISKLKSNMVTAKLRVKQSAEQMIADIREREREALESIELILKLDPRPPPKGNVPPSCPTLGALLTTRILPPPHQLQENIECSRTLIMQSPTGNARHQPPAPTSAPHPSSGSSFPDLLAVPTNLPNLPDSIRGGNSAGSEDVDFDDLTGRFENLKKK